VTIDAPTSPMLDVAVIGPQRPLVSEALQQRIDDAVRGIITSGLREASEVLQRHRALLERGAQELLEKETLDEEAIRTYQTAVRGA
jgi:cell division protease FtsH